MKKYTKPAIEVVTISSSAPIAFKSCTGDDTSNWDKVERWEDNKGGLGISCVNYLWVRGS